jgi:hypothetical protein
MQSGKNYQAWQINTNDFPSNGTVQDQMKFLLRYAVLAPSSHNSQPWHFSLQNDTLNLEIDKQRSLPISDSNHRQLIISLGCAIKNLLLAADFFSMPLSISYFPHGEYHNSIATITGSQRVDIKQLNSDHLASYIIQRRTNRNKYDMSRLPDESFLEKLKDIPNSEIRIDIIHEKKQRESIADVVVAAGIEAMSSSGFRHELSQYLISNISNSGTGMPGFSIGMPTPPSLVIPRLIRYVNFSKLSKAQDEKLLKESTPIFCIISSKEDSPSIWLQVGEYFEEKALSAEKLGLAIAPLAAAIQIGDNYKRLQDLLGTNYRPQFFFRLGYPIKKALHSPRLSAEELIS